MLDYQEHLGHRTASAKLPAFSDSEIQAALGVLQRFYGADLKPAVIVPLDNEDSLRDAIEAVAPGVAACGRELRAALDTSHSSLIVERCGLAHLPSNDRISVLYALSLFMGHPTATSNVDPRVPWDVKVRPSVKASTFSEHAGEADLHTDTQYLPEPERYMLLYCIKPAACGGGISSMRDVESICAQMQVTEDGRWAMDLLMGQELPFKVPAVFTRDGSHDTTEVTFAKVLGGSPRIRYRSDTLENGLAARPDYDTPDVRRALGILRQTLETAGEKVEYPVGADGLLAMNNHEALHGRKEFTDAERHFVRIRIAGVAPLDAAHFSYGG